MEEKYGIEPNSTKEYDGKDLPKIINELLTKNNGILFGGSSLIHDIYFPKEDWQDRDYDLWCTKYTYARLKQYLKTNSKFKEIKNETYRNNYNNLKICAISEFIVKDEINIKLQLINCGDSFKEMLKHLDFSFNTVMYNGKKLIFFKTSETEILEKKGKILNFTRNNCNCSHCRNLNKINNKVADRIKKYQNRGFTFTNLCLNCNLKILDSNHFIQCICKINSDKYLIEINEEKTTEILDLANSSKNPDIILCCLSFFSRTLNMEYFINVFNDKKNLIDISSNIFNTNLYDFGKNGQYTFFKLFFELMKPKLKSLTGKRIQQIFEIVCENNFINIAKYISEQSPRFQINIFEDKITRYKFLSIFEFYLESSDISVLTKEMPNIKITDTKYDEQGEEIICPICKCFPTNLELKCGHNFCDKCIISYFALETNKKNDIKCATCRCKIYNYPNISPNIFSTLSSLSSKSMSTFTTFTGISFSFINQLS